MTMRWLNLRFATILVLLVPVSCSGSSQEARPGLFAGSPIPIDRIAFQEKESRREAYGMMIPRNFPGYDFERNIDVEAAFFGWVHPPLVVKYRAHGFSTLVFHPDAARWAYTAQYVGPRTPEMNAICHVEVSDHSKRRCWTIGCLDHDLRMFMRILRWRYHVNQHPPRRADLRVVRVGTNLIYAGSRVPEERWDIAYVGWHTADGILVLIQFQYYERLPRFEDDAVIAAYLWKYPSAIRCSEVDMPEEEVRRKEVAKVLQMSDSRYFMAVAFHPGAWDLSGPPPPMAELKAWWEKRKGNSMEQLKLECQDKLMDRLRALCDKDDVEGISTLTSMASELFHYLLHPFFNQESVLLFRNDKKLRDDHRRVWFAWWDRARGKPPPEQARLLIDLLIDGLNEALVLERETTGDVTGHALRLVRQICEIPVPVDESYPERPETKRRVIRAWKEWWAKNRETHVPKGIANRLSD